jgi:hypothetical protein
MPDLAPSASLRSIVASPFRTIEWPLAFAPWVRAFHLDYPLP